MKNNPSSEIAASSTVLGENIIATAIRNSAFVFGSQIILKIFGVLFNIYIVRKLGAVHFGRYATVMAFIMIFSIFTDLGMTPYAIRQMAEDQRQTKWLLPNIIIMRSLLSLAIIVIAPLSAMLIDKEQDIVLGIFIASLGQLLYAAQGPLESALTARERLDLRAAFAMVNQFIFWGLGVFLLVMGLGFIGLIIASLVGVGVTAMLSAWALVTKLDVRDLALDPRRWFGILRSSLPFGVSSLADAFLQRFDTILMSFILTDAAVGWYNAPYSLITMMLLLAQSIAISIYPSMVRGYTTDPKSLSEITFRSIKYLLLICLPVVIGGSILADKIIYLLYTREFAPSVPVLRLILWALPSLFLLELLGRIANTLHLEKPAARINVLNAIFTVVLNLLLVPSLGVIGGALALVIGRLIRLIQFWLLLKERQLIIRGWQSLIRIMVAAILMGGVVYLLRGSSVILCIGIGAGIYGSLALGLNVVDIRELRFLGAAVIKGNKI